MSELLDVALYHNSLGRPVLAITPGKKPYDYETGYDKWFTEPQTEDQVREIFSNGAYGIALMAWPASNLCVLDFDGKHAAETWEKTGISLPETARNFTQSGYFHLIFEMDADAISEGATLGRGIRLVKADCDCKRDGKFKPCGVDFLIRGYFIVPPTKNYKEDPDAPFERFAKIPAEVIRLAAKIEAVEGGYRQRFNTERALNGVPEGERDDVVFKLACSLRGAKIPQDMAEELILKAARNCDPPFPDDRALKKVARAYAKYKPRERKAKTSANSGEDGTGFVDIQNLTDLGNAKRFAAMHAGSVFYSAHRKKWVIWNGERWQWDETGAISDYAEKVIQEIYAEASRQTDKSMREAVSAHAVKSESRGKIEAMLALAQGLPDIRTDLTRFDKDLFLLNVANATIELATGTARPFEREDFITRMSPTPWDKDAECPRFMKFLKLITLEREDLADFIQCAAGYSLTGSIQEQCFFIATGTGGNGKTTLLNTFVRVLGPDYAQQIKTEILFNSKYENRDYHVAELQGIRLAAACENEKRRTLATAFVKQATGGEMLVGRRPFELPIRFFPNFKLWFGTNHLPRIDDTTISIWRRIHSLPFDASFEGEREIKGYEEKLLEERSGILKWMVDGCVKWKQAGKLIPPDIVKVKTKAYREDEDIVGSFIADECLTTAQTIIEKEPTVVASVLYESYVAWCKKQGEKEETWNAFGRALTEKGYTAARVAGVRRRIGLRLKTFDERQTENADGVTQ